MMHNIQSSMAHNNGRTSNVMHHQWMKLEQLMPLNKVMFHYGFGIALVQKVLMKCNFFGPLHGTLLLLI
jgi:hypothetical protein